MPRHPAKGASLDPCEAVAEDDAVADDVAIAERAYCAAVTLWSHLTEVAVVVGYSLSSLMVPCVAYPTLELHKDVVDNVAEASSRVQDNL